MESNTTITKQNVYKDNDGYDDLLFEMEDEECDRRRSQSFDSFSSDHTFGGSTREPSIVTKIRAANREDHRNSLPRSRKQTIPSISLQFSAHTESSWEEDSAGFGNRECSSSLSSVEEATEEKLTKLNFSPARRKSNNLDISDSSFISKSPRFLPKFLRTSFSRLISKEKCKTPVPRLEPMSLPFFSTSTPVTRSPSLSPGCSAKSLDSLDTDDNEDDTNVSDDCSPTTKQFVEESLAKGLPLIPFCYSTAQIVEKRIQEKRKKHLLQISSHFNSEGIELRNNRKTRSVSPNRSNIDKDELCVRLTDKEMHQMKMENNSLQSVLRIAKKEMEEEAVVRKISDITGYAANNSRALQRRRSSISEYVGMSDVSKDPGGEESELCQHNVCSKDQCANILESNSSLYNNFSVDDHKHKRESKGPDVNQNKYIQRSFVPRTPSIDQYLNMDGGPRGMTTVV